MTPLRRGTALITALVILVGLVLLGLPFLFSQSASRAGASAFATAQAARAYLVSAENLGLALAIYTQEGHWTQGGTQGYTALEETLKDFGDGVLPTPLPELIPRKTPPGANRAEIDLRTLPGAWNQPGDAVRVGLTLEDESGRLDMNSLGPVGWAALLQKVGLGVANPGGQPGPTAAWADWDDNEVYDQLGNPPPYYNDPDHLGQLVNRIIGWRVEHRFTQIEDLLQVDPQTAPGPDSTNVWWRPRLSRAELERLRPYLTVHTQGQGRAGLVDAGSIVAIDAPGGTTSYLYGDPGMGDAVASDGFIRAVGLDAQGKHAEGTLGVSTLNGTWFHLAASPGVTLSVAHLNSTGGANPFAQKGEAVLAAVPASVNVHALTPTVGYVLAAIGDRNYNLAQGLTAPQPADADGNPRTSAPFGPIVKTLTQLASVNGAMANLLPYTQSAWLFPGNAVARAGIPLEIAGYGLTRITAQVQAIDLRGHPAARASRTIIAQALPQEGLLERRWLTQGQLQTLVDQRFASRLATMPNPVDRVQNVQADDPLPVGNAAPVPKAGTGLTARPLPDITHANVTPTHLSIDWRATFGAGAPAADAMAALAGPQTVATGLVNVGTDWTQEVNTALANDGLHLKPDQRIAWKLDDTGPFKRQNTTNFDLAARHLSGWFCPTEAWTGNEPLILLEARTPVRNTIPQADGTAGSNELQNLVQLAWDPKNNWLVLSLAPPAVEHPVDTPVIRMGAENTQGTGTAYPRKDPRSLATASDLSVAPAQGNDANLKAVSPCLRTNRITLIYKVPGGMPVGQWRHLQVVIGGSHPGGLALLLDGIAGRDLTLDGDASIEKTGDHALLPVLRLDTPLPLVGIPTTAAQTNLLFPTNVKVVVGPLAAAAGLKATDLFPTRGVIRLHEEYITYDRLSDTGILTGCRRGARQDTAVGPPTPAISWWPRTQAHEKGSLVLPGSIRAQLFGGTQDLLYAGKTTLKDPLTGGDTAADSIHPNEVWGRFSVVGDSVQIGSDLTLVAPVLTWPSSGIVEVQVGGRRNFFRYQSVAGGVLKNLQSSSDGASFTNSGYLTNPIPMPLDLANANEIRTVRLLSIEVVEDPLPPAPRAAFPAMGLIQIMDDVGRVEWIAYDDIIKVPNGAGGMSFYFTNHAGFGPNARGRDRTIFDPNPTRFFPSGSLVLPVQALNDAMRGAGWLLTPGDVVTFLPPDASAGPARQMVVRYVATDGYGNAAADPASLSVNDTYNGHFAFTQAWDADPTKSVLANGWEIVTGPGWSFGSSITPGAMNSAPPRTDRMTEPGANNEARLLIGSGDVARGALGTGQKGMILDNWGAGPWFNASLGIIAFFTAGAATDTLTDTDGLDRTFAYVDSGVLVTPKLGLIDLDGEVFAYRNASAMPTQAEKNELNQAVETWYQNLGARTIANAPTALAAPSGSAPPPRNWVGTQQFVQLIGRGLLGSRPRTHRVSALDGADLPNTGWPKLTALRLPVGPVGILTEPDNLNAGNWATLESAEDHFGFPGINAPDLLVADPFPQSGTTAVEVVRFTAPNQRPITRDFQGNITIDNPDLGKSMVVPWLRGGYNSEIVTWQKRGTLNPLLIGWWPRFASALPNGTLTPQHYRSRSYAWAGFPLRLVRARYSGDTPFTVFMEPNTPANDGLDQLFTLTARAMAGTVAESATKDGALDQGGYSNWMPRRFTAVYTATASNALRDLYADFANQETDGVEVRLTWQYKTAPSSDWDRLAEAMNRAPVIKGVTMTTHAPACVVGVEER